MKINLNLEVESSKDIEKLQAVLSIFQEASPVLPSSPETSVSELQVSPEKQAFEEKLEIKRRGKKEQKLEVVQLPETAETQQEPAPEPQPELATEPQANDEGTQETQAVEETQTVEEVQGITLDDLRQLVSEKQALKRAEIIRKLKELLPEGNAKTSNLRPDQYSEFYKFLISL